MPRDNFFTVLDQAQEYLDDAEGGANKGVWDLRSMMWEIIGDVKDSYSQAFNAMPFMTDNEVKTIEDTVNSYLANNYGDD